jgi:tRNA(fMet)-specific endonuclease VapC
VNGSYLLDSNIIISLFNGDKKTTKWLLNAESVFVPYVVIGELYYGAYKSGQKKSNMKKIDDFISFSSILNSTADTSKLYGFIKNQLKTQGKPMPENDIWIAALAIQYGVTLITRDNHFNNVKNLPVEIWP